MFHLHHTLTAPDAFLRTQEEILQDLVSYLLTGDPGPLEGSSVFSRWLDSKPRNAGTCTTRTWTLCSQPSQADFCVPIYSYTFVYEDALGGMNRLSQYIGKQSMFPINVSC